MDAWQYKRESVYDWYFRKPTNVNFINIKNRKIEKMILILNLVALALGGKKSFFKLLLLSLDCFLACSLGSLGIKGLIKPMVSQKLNTCPESARS